MQRGSLKSMYEGKLQKLEQEVANLQKENTELQNKVLVTHSLLSHTQSVCGLIFVLPL